MNNDDFEWDDAKAAANLKKHQVSFATAARVFDDPDLYIVADTGHYDEQGFIAIGMVNARLIAAIYTERGETVRIISARKASKHEQNTYYQS
jgi:hypothetical protein